MLNLDDRVTAAAIAAAGTVIGTLIQLHMTWRREVSDRARGVPASKKSRRGPVLAVGLLLVGAALGGFAFSQYLARQSDLEAAAMRGQLQLQLAQMNATAVRLERAALSDHGSSERTADDRRGAERAAATATVGPCRTRTIDAADATAACGERDAQQITFCASVPALAVVTATVLYARPVDSPQSWSESRVAPGQQLGHLRFADKAFERAESEDTKQVCTGFSSWDADHGYTARLVVKYTLAPDANVTAPAVNVVASAPNAIAPAANVMAPSPSAIAPTANVIAPAPNAVASAPSVIAPAANVIAPAPSEASNAMALPVSAAGN